MRSAKIHPTTASPPAAWQAADDLSPSRNYEIKLVPLREMGPATEGDSPEKVAAYFRAHVVTAPCFDPCRENLVTLFLDTRRRITGFTFIGIGTLDGVLASPREVFRAAIVRAASAIILAHNHTSGDPSPSLDDIKKTQQLLRAGQLLQIQLLDHLIMGEKHLDPSEAGYCSLKDLGYFAALPNVATHTMPKKRPTHYPASHEVEPACYQPGVSAKLSALFDDWTGPPATKLSNISDRQLLETCLAAQNELVRRANAGNDEPTDYVFRLAMRSVGVLNELAVRPSSFLLSLAQANPIWPAWYCPKKSFLDEYRPIWTQLRVGSNCQDNVEPNSKWKLTGDVARQWACKIIVFVQETKTAVAGVKTDHPEADNKWTPLTKAAYKLPPRTKATVPRWMNEVGKPLIMKLTQGRPEANTELRKVAESWHRRNTSAKKDSDTLRTILRTDIFRRIEQTMQDMTSQP